MTNGYISTKTPTAFFTSALPTTWIANYSANYAGNNLYNIVWNRTIVINGTTYYQYNGWQTYGPTSNNNWSPGNAAYSITDNIYVGSTAYIVKNAKQISITSSGANGEIKRNASGTYYSLPYTALFADGDTLTIVLKAFPSTHFVWDPATSKWNHDDDTNQERTLTVASSFANLVDKAYAATYTQTEWLLTTQASNANGNAYIGASGTETAVWFAQNAIATIRAVVSNIAYKFKRWTVGDVEVSTEPSIQLTTSNVNKTYVAVFIPINYTLNVYPQNAGQGAVEVYLAGVKQVTTMGLTVVGLSSVEVRAVATFGYYLVGWHNGTSIVSYGESYPFSMSEANLSLEARFAILPDAALVVTKKKGSGTPAPEDMGSVTLYHTVDTFVVASAVGELTLNASMFTTKQYRLAPAPASALYQFDGWYQTVDGSDVLIVDDSVFNVDGNDLYVTVADETQINVIARFSERTLCTIEPVVSDSSTYSEENEAEDAGCTCFVSTLPPDNDQDSDGEHDSGDQWLSGQTISVEARQAAGWELRAWYVIRISDGVTVASKAKGDTGFGQVFSFTLLANVQVIAVSAYTLPADQVQIQTLLKSGQPLESGTLEIHPCGENYVELENGATANVDDGGECEITAIPANGYRFVGWRVASEGSAVISTNPVYSFTVNGNAIYYAEFAVSDGEALKLFEGSDSNMTLRWAGKTYLAPMPICLSSARIYADAYPVRLDIGMSDNPSHPAIATNVLTSTAQTQNPFRLPMRRPRKSIVLTIEATDVVSEVSVGTSMEGLKNG
jgi:hypothetical protein